MFTFKGLGNASFARAAHGAISWQDTHKSCNCDGGTKETELMLSRMAGHVHCLMFIGSLAFGHL